MTSFRGEQITDVTQVCCSCIITPYSQPINQSGFLK